MRNDEAYDLQRDGRIIMEAELMISRRWLDYLRQHLGAFAIAIALMASWSSGVFADDAPDNVAKLGEKAPMVQLRTLDGKSEDPIADLCKSSGKAIVVEFWATWCLPCAAAAERLGGLQELLAGELVVIGVTKEHPDIVRKYLTKHKISYSVLLDESGSMHRAYNIDSFPTAALIDRYGVLAWVGTPSVLTEAAMRDFVASGTLPPKQVHALNIAESETVFEIKVAPVNREGQGSGVEVVKRAGGVRVRASNASLMEIVGTILEVTPARIVVDNPSTNPRLSVSITFPRLQDPILTRTRVAELIASVVGVKLARVSEECEVLVLHPGPVQLIEAPFRQRVRQSFSRDHRMLQGVTIDGLYGLVRYLEEDFNAVVVSELRLEGKYDFEYPVSGKQEVNLSEMEEALGLQIRRERRLIDIVKLCSVEERIP